MQDKFIEGTKLDLGITILTEQEIIDFAKAFDPLYFHTDKEAAKKSIFKTLVASGPHLFTLVHRNKWIPLFGDTVLAGLGVNNWKFIQPVYPNQEIHSSVTLVKVKINEEKQHAAVTWQYEFKDQKGEMVQCLEMTVLHKIN